MNIVRQRFAESDYFIPDLVFSGEILKLIVALLESHLKSQESKKMGKVFMGTVKGDIHDIVRTWWSPCWT